MYWELIESFAGRSRKMGFTIVKTRRDEGVNKSLSMQNVEEGAESGGGGRWRT